MSPTDETMTAGSVASEAEAMNRCALVVLFLALATLVAAEPLDNPYGTCDQQTLDTAIALERLGDREALRDHVRSFGCRLIFPDAAFRPFPPERGDEMRTLRTPR
jgi:hypothetical protein